MASAEHSGVEQRGVAIIATDPVCICRIGGVERIRLGSINVCYEVKLQQYSVQSILLIYAFESIDVHVYVRCTCTCPVSRVTIAASGQQMIRTFLHFDGDDGGLLSAVRAHTVILRLREIIVR